MQNYSAEGRVLFHNTKFSTNPPMVANDRWIIGGWYFWRSKKDNIYGGYPDRYLKKVYSLFPDAENVLHLFSGGLSKEEKGIRFDINLNYKPDIVGDVRDLSKIFKENSFDLVIADPPYEKKDFEIYGCKSFNKGKVMDDLYLVTQENSYVVWLDLFIPMYKKKFWKLVGMISFAQGSGMRVRMVSIFERYKDKDKSTIMNFKTSRLVKLF